MNYFNERNEGIEEDNIGYVHTKDVINMILKNPRIINSDIQNNIVAKCQVLTEKKEGNIGKANELIKSNPGVFRKTIKTIKEGR